MALLDVSAVCTYVYRLDSCTFFSFIECCNFFFFFLHIKATLQAQDEAKHNINWVNGRRKEFKSKWRRANTRNVSFETLYGGKFKLSTHLMMLNYLVILSHRSSTTVSTVSLKIVKNVKTFFALSKDKFRPITQKFLFLVSWFFSWEI